MKQCTQAAAGRISFEVGMHDGKEEEGGP